MPPFLVIEIRNEKLVRLPPKAIAALHSIAIKYAQKHRLTKNSTHDQ